MMLKTNTSQCKSLKFTGYFPQHLIMENVSGKNAYPAMPVLH